MNTEQIDKWINEAEEIDVVYSNLDHLLNEKIAEKLKSGNFRSHHPAWEFSGMIIFREGKFIERVMRYKALIAYYENEDIQDLIDNTNKNHGGA